MGDRLCICVAALLLVAWADSVTAVDLPAADRARLKACLDLNTTLDQRECMGSLHRATSQELADVYRQTLEKAAASDHTAAERDGPARPGWADAIAKSQMAWEAYRDAQCWDAEGSDGGSGRMMWVYGCLAEKTLERIRELKLPFVAR